MSVGKKSSLKALAAVDTGASIGVLGEMISGASEIPCGPQRFSGLRTQQQINGALVGINGSQLFQN